jgi:hypothetical protein
MSYACVQTRTPAIGRDAANEADRQRDRLRHVERELAQANVELGQHRKGRRLEQGRSQSYSLILSAGYSEAQEENVQMMLHRPLADPLVAPRSPSCCSLV